MGYKLEIMQMLLKRPSEHFRKHIKKEKIDNKTIQYAQIDKLQPTVVFENGMGAGMKFWDEVFFEIGKTNTVFAYNRNDKKVSTDRVELLRKLLLIRGLKPPYVLVGHSLGGAYIQYFARKYPDEVSGIVLVDAPHPNEFEDLSTFPKKLLRLFTNVYKEINAVGQKILALPTTHAPVYALVATQKRFTSQYKEYIPMIDMMHEKAKDYPNLYPQCTLQWVDTGHVVMYENPEVVSEAIKEVINKLK